MNKIKGFDRRQTPRPGDYYDENNVLICGICGKPREWHGTWPQINDTWACCVCCCDLNKNEQAAREAERRSKIKLAKMHRSWAFPFDENLTKINFALDDGENPKASKAVKKYAHNLADNLKVGKNLFIYGDAGTGKTFMAAAVLNAAIDDGYRCYFTSFYREIENLKNARNKNEYLQSLKDYDFVAFDDFGTERETDFNLEQIYQIINARYNSNRPSIITTNMDNAEFSTDEPYKKRIFSRIFEKAEPILINGQDRRRRMFRA